MPADDRGPIARAVPVPGHVNGAPRIWLRLEGAAVFALALWLYAGESWLLFAALVLVPDLSFAAYLAGARIGAAAYNAMHSYVLPLALAAAGIVTDTVALPVALVWIAHIGFDRMVGYGLKYPTAFQETHLGRIGRNAGNSA